MNNMWSGLTPPYRTIVADPPWHYDVSTNQWGDKAALDMPYSTMSTEEITAMPVADLAAPGAHLFIWTTNRYLWDARDVVHEWGFAPVQVLVWAKPPAGLGPGGTFANTVEFIVYARNRSREIEGHMGDIIREAREAAGKSRSDLVPLFLSHYKNADSVKAQMSNWELGKNVPGKRDWNLLVGALPALAGVERVEAEPARRARIDTSWWQWSRGAHSVKPAAFLDLVEKVAPGPYVELFARQPRLGWDSWGYGYELNRETA